MKEWKIIHIEKIMEEPVKIDLERLGSSLFVASAFTFCWKDGILFSYSQHRESFYKEDEKEIAFVHFFYNIECTELFKYRKFLELSLVDSSIRFTDRTDEKSSVIYFPIEKVEGSYYDKIVEKIKEKQYE